MFKILSVIFAFTLWVTVYNMDDPTKTKTLTVNVTVTNKEVLEEMEKYYEILDGTNKASFSVTAPRSILEKLDETDFTAEANLEKLSVEKEGTRGSVPIEISCTANVNKNSIKLSTNSKNLMLSLEELMTKQFVVQANTTGEVAEGYALGTVEVTAPNVLKVSGPKSIVSEIQSAIATVDVNGISESMATYRATPVLLDAEGNEINTARLTLSDTTVNVEAEILNMKEVGISVTPSGETAEGYVVTNVRILPNKIDLKGKKKILNSVSTISIPSEVVSVEGASEDVSIKVDVSEYIPDGLELAKQEQALVEIIVSVDKIKTKSYSIQTSDILVTGLPTHTTLEYALSSVAVNVTGLETNINALTGDMLVGSIDVTDLSVGTHEVEVALDLDEAKYTYDTIKVTITIVETS